MVAPTREPHLLLSRGLLESAIHKPRSYWHYDDEDDAVILAVTLLFGISRNHAFEQGNKRTGFDAALIFLHANGYAYAGPDSYRMGKCIKAVIEGRVADRDFERLFRRFVVPEDELMFDNAIEGAAP